MAKQMAPDPAIGTWKLNVAKSSFKLTPPLKSSIGKVEAWEDGLKASIDSVDRTTEFFGRKTEKLS